jgi:Cu+-exporting ATPase
VISFAAVAERRSEHFFAEAILLKAKEMKFAAKEPTFFESIPGRGVFAKFGRDKILVGNAGLMKLNKVEVEFALKNSEALERTGNTVLFVSLNSKLIGLVAVSDSLKANAFEAVEKLKKLGKEVVLLTGDNRAVAEIIARRLGIEKVFSNVLPHEKEKIISSLQRKGKSVAMVGDGVNDAPALARSDVGIAIGSGTDVALEAGEIVLMRNDLNGVVDAIQLSAYAISKIRQNLFWAFFYNIIGIPIAAGALYLSFGILLNPIIAGLAMSFSSVSVVLNALSMNLYSREA